MKYVSNFINLNVFEPKLMFVGQNCTFKNFQNFEFGKFLQKNAKKSKNRKFSNFDKSANMTDFYDLQIR